jgi:hypothetical protein
MVRVNRHDLPKKDFDKLLLQFDSLIGKLDQKGTGHFLGELLGPEERLTFAKRFATIVLLSNGISEYKTAQVLKLSPTTTGKIGFEIQRGTYTGIIRLLQKNKRNYLDILNTIDSILHLGGILPHRVGMDRYRNL